MPNQPTFNDIFLDEITIPHESNKSKAIFEEYIKHDANITLKELSKITDCSYSTIRRYYKKYKYQERADTFLSHKIKKRAEYGINQGNTFDVNNFEMVNVNTQLHRKLLKEIQKRFDNLLETIPPKELWKYFKDLHYLQKVNIENGHTCEEALIESMKFIVQKNEDGTITEEQTASLMKELMDEWTTQNIK